MWPQRNPLSYERPFVAVTHGGSPGCVFCQQRTLDAEALRAGTGHGRGKQLGRIERAILLDTARSQAGLGSFHEGRRTPVLTKDGSISQQTALRSAAARLRAAGLITLRRSTPLETDLFLKAGYETGAISRPTARDRSRLRRRLAKVHWSRRTLLGDGVVIAYRDVLETPTQRLRWDGRLEFALLGAHTRCICRHSDQFRAEVERDLGTAPNTPVRVWLEYFDTDPRHKAARDDLGNVLSEKAQEIHVTAHSRREARTPRDHRRGRPETRSTERERRGSRHRLASH